MKQTTARNAFKAYVKLTSDFKYYWITDSGAVKGYNTRQEAEENFFTSKERGEVYTAKQAIKRGLVS